MIGKYEDRLFGTHLNDNLGVTGDVITWHDDAHLLPFDGVADWEGIVARLKKAGYKGELTAELTLKNKPNRHTHDRYHALSPDEYLTEAYRRLSRIRRMLDGE
jgi:sugar phosphate isomerase/epimerase